MMMNRIFRAAALGAALLITTLATAQESWPEGAFMELSPVAAPVGVLEESAVAWIEARLALRTTPEAAELRIDALIDLEDMADAAIRATSRRWKNDKCGDQLETKNVEIELTDRPDTLRISFDVAYKRNQCLGGVARTTLFRATGRATVDLTLLIEAERPVLSGVLVPDDFNPEFELLGGVGIDGLDDAEVQQLLVGALQGVLDSELDKANQKIQRALDDAPVTLRLLSAEFTPGPDQNMALAVEAAAIAEAEAVDLVIDAALTRGFN